MTPESSQIDGWLDLISHGGMPLVILTLIYVVYQLWRTVQRRDDAIASRDEIIAALHSKRADDGLTCAKLLAEQTAAGAAAIGSNTTQLAAWADRVQSAVDLIKQLGPEHVRILGALDRNADKIDALAIRIGSGAAR